MDPFVTTHGVVHVKQEPLDHMDLDLSPCSMMTANSTISLSQAPLFLAKYSRLDNHLRSRTYDFPQNSCEVCQGEFSDQAILMQHKLLHFNTSHVCYMCDCYFVSTQTMIMHMATIHRNLNPSLLGSKADADRAFVCSICLQRFSSNKMLMVHQNHHKVAEDAFFGCKVCGLDFIGYRALMAHLNASRHKEMKIKIQSIFVCVDCRSIFASRDSYAMHMMMRAQNETCSTKYTLNRIDPTGAGKEAIAIGDTDLHGVNSVDQELQSVKQEQSSAMSPLNLTVQKPDEVTILPGDTSPKHAVQRHSCTKCGLDFFSDGAFAMHIMMHVKNDVIPQIKAHQREAYVHTTSIVQNGSFSAPLPTTVVTAHVQHRPNSAPMCHNFATKTGSMWTCNICMNVFSSCDALAMHVMEVHANEDSETEYLRRQASQSYDLQPDDLIPITREEISETKIEMQNGEKEDEMLPENRNCKLSNEALDSLGTGQNKRCSSVLTNISCENPEESQPKRCRSESGVVGKANCLFCHHPYSSRRELDQHLVDDHGVGLKSACCQVCGLVFLHYQALKIHLRSARHAENMMVRRFICGICAFGAASESQFESHKALHVTSDDGQPQTESKTVEGSTIDSSGSSKLIDASNEDSRTIQVTGSVASVCVVSTNEEDISQSLHMLPQSNGTGELKSPIEYPTVSSSHGSSRRRKSLSAWKIIQPSQSPPLSEGTPWLDNTSDTDGSPTSSTAHVVPVVSPSVGQVGSYLPGMASSRLWPQNEYRVTMSTEQTNISDSLQQPSTTTSSSGGLEAVPVIQDPESDGELLDCVLANANKLSMCKHCKIIYTDKTMYYLHMGLHNLNNPWQCNLCGKACRNVHEFSSHVIHY